MAYGDEGDSMVMRMPDGVILDTGFTCEHAYDRDEFDARIAKMYQRWAEGEDRQVDPEMPAIYCFLNGGSSEWWNVAAVAEDGTGLAGHICSSAAFFHHDLGLTSDWKHDKYQEHYPHGYRLVWEDVHGGTHSEGCKRAIAIGNARVAEKAIEQQG